MRSYDRQSALSSLLTSVAKHPFCATILFLNLDEVDRNTKELVTQTFVNAPISQNPSRNRSNEFTTRYWHLTLILNPVQTVQRKKDFDDMLRRIGPLVLFVGVVLCGCTSTPENSSDYRFGGAFYIGAARSPLGDHPKADEDGNTTGTDIALGITVDNRETGTVLSLYPMHGFAFNSGTIEGYRWETFDDSQRVCRDTSNGQFAKQSKCSGTVDYIYTPSAEITQQLGSILRIGIGYRGGDWPETFGVLFFGSDRGYLGFRGADNYASISLGRLF